MKRKRKIVGRIVKIAIVSALVMAGIMVWIGVAEVKKAYLNSFSQELKSSAFQLEDSLSNRIDGDWSISSSGELVKGDTEVYVILKEQLEALTDKTGIAYSVIYGNVRYITTVGDRETSISLEGTTVSDEVSKVVLEDGEDYLAENIELAGEKWYTYYTPLKNSDGTIIGMIYAGNTTTEVLESIAQTTTLMGVVALLFAIVFSGVGYYAVRVSTKAMDDIVAGLEKLAEGDLNISIQESTLKRKDEIGTIAESTLTLKKELEDVISSSLELSHMVTTSGDHLASSAATATEVSGQVTVAVEDISRGSVAQAENVEDSVGNTEQMGNSIDDISESVGDLSSSAEEMMLATNRTVEALEQLMAQNKSVMISMGEIDQQIQATNRAVREIADATNIIKDISNQTNLLSLNASIEAARAGEAGRGFGVVATEISILADQSRDAAATISEIIETLVGESQKSVETILKLNEGFNVQNNQIQSTKKDMDGMVHNVQSVEEDTQNITEKVRLLEQNKVKLSDIISELSAISQENAAYTEETNASMEELNATFTLISDSAHDLKDLARSLNDKMKFFRLDSAETEVIE